MLKLSFHHCAVKLDGYNICQMHSKVNSYTAFLLSMLLTNSLVADRNVVAKMCFIESKQVSKSKMWSIVNVKIKQCRVIKTKVYMRQNWKPRDTEPDHEPEIKHKSKYFACAQHLSSGPYPSQSMRYWNLPFLQHELRIALTVYAGCPSMSRGRGGVVVRTCSARGQGVMGFKWDTWNDGARRKCYGVIQLTSYNSL